MSNSPLVSYTRISPNRNSPRTQKISKITIHHMAGVMSVEGFGEIVSKESRGMSANYAIGSDARVGLFCPEEDRSWCSSSPWNDHRAVTIEVSNSACTPDWPIADHVWAKLIDLCVDICKRNDIPKLTFTGDQNGSLTFHYMFTSTACLPIDRTELLTPSGWKLLKDITYDDKVATVHMDTLGIKFDDVEGIVPVKTQDTYTIRDFEATSDHRVLYTSQPGRQYIGEFKDLYNKQAGCYFQNAGVIENPEGLDLSLEEIEFLAAVQADGSYMKDGDCLYGIEFHFSKERKIKRVQDILIALGIPYTLTKQSNGTVKIRIYGTDYVNSCERYLDNKQFTWDWLNMNAEQFEAFYNAILFYDGCVANMSYSSNVKTNIDIVQAIASINGVGSKVNKEHNRVYFKSNRRSLGVNQFKRNLRQKVSCVTVRSGFILIRQNGRTTITGNCPGPFIKSRAQQICDQVNARLNNNTNTKPAESNPIGVTNRIEKDCWVKIKPGSKYWNGQSIPSWVMDDVWRVSEVSGKRAVLGVNDEGNRNIQSPINVDCLINIKAATSESFTAYTKTFKKGTTIYKTPGKTDKAGVINKDGVYTIIEEKKVDKTLYGKLKSGAGYVVISGPAPDMICVGDTVKVLSNKQYNGMTFKIYQDTYKVLSINNDRVVISADGKNVTAAVNKNNLQKV